MESISDFIARQAREAQQRNAAAAGVVINAAAGDPDQLAGDLKLATDWAKTTGKQQPPASMVSEYRPIFQQQIEEQKNSTILASSPVLTEWLADPQNAALARDDMENMSWFEASIRRGILRTKQGANQYMAFENQRRADDTSRSFSEILSDRTAIRDRDGRTVSQPLIPGPDDLFAAGSRFVQSRLADALGINSQDEAVAYQQAAGEVAERIASIPMTGPASEFRERLFGDIPEMPEDATFWDRTGSDLRRFAEVVGENPTGFVSFLTQVAVESFPLLAATGVVSATTRSPGAAAIFMGTSSGLTEAGVAPMEFFDEMGIDVSTPEGALAALTDPEILDAARQRGYLRGLMIGAFDGLSGGIAGQQLAATPVGNAVLQSISQAILGGLGEASAQIVSGQEFDINEVIIEALAEFVTAPIEVGSIRAGQFVQGYRSSRDAEDRRAVFEELSGQAVNSKLRARMPEAFRNFIERATQDGPVENVFVPADQFVQYFQSQGLDPYQVAESLTGVAQGDLDTALATGADLRIPTATYAAEMAGSPHDNFMFENMRLDPDQMTSAEARRFNEAMSDAMEEAYAEAERMRQTEERFKTFEAEIYDTMVSRLRAAGRSTDVATSEALLYPAFYRTMADRMGMGIDEFMQRYPLPQVQGDLPQGIQARNVDELTRTLAEARRFRESGAQEQDRRRTPLLEFISDYGGILDQGGELASRDAAVIQRGRGRRNLRLARDPETRVSSASAEANRNFGADAVAQAAIEAGFMADNPLVLEYQEAMRTGREVPDITRALFDEIDRELSGQASMTQDRTVYGDETADDTMAALDEYLSRIGVSLDDDDAVIRAAIDRDQAEARMYGQDGPDSFSQDRRGSIQFPFAGIGNGDTVINLFRSANLSTFAHESGHFFLTIMQDLAQRGVPEAQTDYQVIKDWWRTNAGDVAKDAMRGKPDIQITDADVITMLDNGTTGDALKDAAIDVGMQEQAARAFEAYLMEGKAPSPEVRGVFDKFRAWLLSVYKSLRGLNVQPSDELRAVFDRMLATDDEIAQARAAIADDGPVFTSAEQLGMTEEQYQAFLKLSDDAQAEAQAKLLNEIMAPIRREAQKWYKDERQKVQADVEREVNAYKHYRALEWMGNRRWLGEDKPESLSDMRMSKDMLVERFGAGVLDTLPRGRQTIYAVEGGVDPEMAAELFGFSSADEMIKALERAPSRKEAIEAETDRVMNERHMDPLVDGTVQEKALEAIHGDKRAQALEVELKALTEIAGSDRGITRQEARQIARRTLARTQVRDAVATNRYLAAERRAAQEAQKLAAEVTRTKMWADAARRKVGVSARAAVREGDAAALPRMAGQIDQANTRTMRSNDAVQKLIDAKRRQLLNHMLYVEAKQIEAEVEVAENLARRLRKKSTRDNLAGDYLGAIDEILNRYDFRKISATAEDRRGALLEYVQRMTEAGRENELAIPERVLQDANRTPYKRLTVEHLRGVVGSLKNIEHTARLKKTLQDAQAKRDLDAVVEEIEAAFDANVSKRPPSRVGNKAEQRRQGVRGFLDLVLNAGTLLREIDGFEDFGPAFRNLKAPIDQAMNRLQGRRQKAAEDLAALYDNVYSRAEQRRMNTREHIPEIDASMSKWERIAVALNMGNDGNYQRLTDTRVRGGFTEDQVQAIIRTLDERDARFVQSVWDYLETFRPDIAARERRLTGIEPNWVEARPVEIAGVTLKGGYYPLKYDPRLSAAARDDQSQDIAATMKAGRYGKAQTKNGHLKEREQSSGRGVELDIAVLHKHVQQVVYDLELSEPVANSWRVLQDPRVRSKFIDAGKQADFDALELWLRDVGTGEIRAADFVSRSSRMLKSNFTAAKLAFNLSTVAVQLTGIAQSMVITGKRDFAAGVVASFRPGVVAEIREKSQFMRDRETTFNKDIFDLYNDPKMGPVTGRWTQTRNEWIAPAGLWLMTKVQFYAVDLPTWLASYEKGLRQFGNDEARALAFADDVVKRAQASGLFSDRSAIERGSTSISSQQNDLLRLFTTLGSYMFAKFNVAYERTARANQTIRREGASLRSLQEALSWSLDMAFLFTLEAVLYAAIKGRLPDDDDEDDDWASFLVRETALSIASTIPFVRDGASVYSGFESGGAYGGIISELTRPIIQAEQGEFDRPFVKSIVNATGLATGIPSGQINRVIDASWRQIEGEDVSPVEHLLGRMGR